MRTAARHDLDVEWRVVVRERVDLELVDDGQGRRRCLAGGGGYLVEGETVQQAREGDEHVAHGEVRARADSSACLFGEGGIRGWRLETDSGLRKGKGKGRCQRNGRDESQRGKGQQQQQRQNAKESKVNG